jgi:hypothetical protein
MEYHLVSPSLNWNVLDLLSQFSWWWLLFYLYSFRISSFILWTVECCTKRKFHSSLIVMFCTITTRTVVFVKWNDESLFSKNNSVDGVKHVSLYKYNKTISNVDWDSVCYCCITVSTNQSHFSRNWHSLSSTNSKWR